jgi:hypothetical protein
MNINQSVNQTNNFCRYVYAYWTQRIESKVNSPAQWIIVQDQPLVWPHRLLNSLHFCKYCYLSGLLKDDSNPKAGRLQVASYLRFALENNNVLSFVTG